MINDKDISKIGSISSERALLGLLFENPDLIVQISGRINESDFSEYVHAYIFMAMKYLLERNNEISPISVYTVLEKRENMLGVLEQHGGLEYLVGLMEMSAFNAEDFDFYIESIKQYSVRRQLLKGWQNIEPVLWTDNVSDVHKILHTVEKLVLDIGIKNTTDVSVKHITDGLEEVISNVKENKGNIPGLSTGFPSFDRLCYGLMPNTVTVIGARPKQGKSALGTMIALNATLSQNVPVLTFDTEMNTREVQLRALSIISQVPLDDVITGRFVNDDEKQTKIELAVQKLNSAKWFHIFSPVFTPETLGNIVRMYHIKEKIGLFIFDYIKIPTIDAISHAREDQWLGELTGTLKEIAGILNIPVITFAQTSQADDERIAYSDKIKQLATCVSILKPRTGKNGLGNYIWKITDIRQGKPGTVYLNFNSDTVTFLEA